MNTIGQLWHPIWLLWWTVVGVPIHTVLKTILMKLEVALDSPAYNYIIHTSPFDTQALPHYHWHLEVIPRLTRVAGFEWGTGFYINPVPPEQAAEFLQGTEVDLTARPKK